MKTKIYCSQCHKSAFCDIQGSGRKYRKLWCWHLKKFIPTHQEIGDCTAVVYENKDLYLSGAWKPATYSSAEV